MCEDEIYLVRGDALSRDYLFLDTSNMPLTPEIIDKAVFTVDRLKYIQELEYDEECMTWHLYIPSRVTKNFEPFVGKYNVTLTLCDGNDVTVIYSERIQVFKKNVGAVHNTNYKQC